MFVCTYIQEDNKLARLAKERELVKKRELAKERERVRDREIALYGFVTL